MDCQAFSIVFFRIPYKKRAAAQFPCAAVFIPLIRPAASAHAAPAFRRIRTPHGSAAFPSPAPPRAFALKNTGRLRTASCADAACLFYFCFLKVYH